MMTESVFTADYEREAERIAEKIDKLRRADTLVFPILTDLHTHTLEEEGVREVLSAMRALSKNVRADGVLALGDNPAMLGREEHASNEKIARLIGGLLDRVSDIWPCPVFAVNGNHDGIGTDFFKADFWHGIVGGRYDGGRAVRDGESAYYTVDFDAQGVRLVFLSLPSGSDLEAEHPAPLWKFGDRQLTWLAQTALNTPHRVLLVCHVPLWYEYRGDETAMLGVWNGTRAAQSYISALCGWIEDRARIEAILKAFHNHESYENAAWGIRCPASVASAGLLACLSGHMHSDSVSRPGEDGNGLPCVQVVTGASDVRINQALREKAAWRPCLDTAVLTPSENRLTMVRFGAGEDREIRL